MNIVWIGKYQEQIEKINLVGSISKYGVPKQHHFVFDNYRYRDYTSFIIEKIIYFNKLSQNIRYYFYDPNIVYEILKILDIKDRIICTNNEFVLKWLNNKSISRMWVQNFIKTPGFQILSNSEISIEYLKNSFWGYDKFVIQNMVSSGGHETYLFDENFKNTLETGLYIVSPYFENSISINVTFMIFRNETLIFPVSVQLIEPANSKLLYAGSDFISAKDIPDGLYNKIIKSTQKITEHLKFLDYRGIGGIDYIIYNNDIFFVEVNPRFQGSSFLIDNALKHHNLSLFYLNIEAFFAEISKEHFEIISNLDISYSFFKDEFKRTTIEERISSIYLEENSNDYYNYFADKYHIMLKNWEDKIQKQGKILSLLFKNYAKIDVKHVLDCTCGIGIQTISLAYENYDVFGSDISQKELEVAKKESIKRNLNIEYFHADCRFLEKSTNKHFDVIISIDSALPHLLTRNNFLLAFKSIYNRLQPGGIFLSSYRDYATLLNEKPNMAYPVRFNKEKDIEYTILRRWKWDDDIIYSKQYVIADSVSGSKLYTNSYKQWAVTKNTLIEIAKETGYSEIHWLLPETSGFSQPILCAVK